MSAKFKRLYFFIKYKLCFFWRALNVIIFVFRLKWTVETQGLKMRISTLFIVFPWHVGFGEQKIQNVHQGCVWPSSWGGSLLMVKKYSHHTRVYVGLAYKHTSSSSSFLFYPHLYNTVMYIISTTVFVFTDLYLRLIHTSYYYEQINVSNLKKYVIKICIQSLCHSTQ